MVNRPGRPSGQGVFGYVVEIYTIGHSTLRGEEFLALLREFSIKIVADVRRFPTSKKHPQFARRALEAELARAGIRYVGLGEELGGYRKGGYEAHMKTAAFASGVRGLLELGGAGRIAVLCAERDPQRCHRRFLAAYLVQRGVRVVHILGPGKVREELPALTVAAGQGGE